MKWMFSRLFWNLHKISINLIIGDKDQKLERGISKLHNDENLTKDILHKR